MMQHYIGVKEKYKDCIVFYRLGDFYEMFFDDAVDASKLLDLTLTGKDCGLTERAPMCGIPYHAAETYIAKLVSLGKKVAICEQMEDPATAKGMVMREVVRVVSAGTVIADESLDSRENNYICCVYKEGDCVAVVWADITTGQLTATEFYGENCVAKAIEKMANLQVREIIANDEMIFASKDEREVKKQILPHFSSYPATAFNYAAAERRTLEQFNAKTLSAYPISEKRAAICATGALLDYLKETQKHALKNIDNVQYSVNEKYLQLDPTAIKNLEILQSIGGGKKYGSLLWLLDKTSTSMGARLLKNSVISPFGRADDINYRLDGVEELFNATVVRLAVIDVLKDISDIERISGRISNGNVTPRDCISLARSLSHLPDLRFKLSGFNSKILSDVAAGLFDLSDVAKLIFSAISEDAPPTLKEGLVIKDGYNARLDELRKIKKSGTSLITEMEARERDVTNIRTLKIKYNRVFGYYIEVSKSFKDKVPTHYQRRQTLSNAERYSTEELKELESKILSSEELSVKLETELYESIKSVLSDNIAKLKKISEAIAALDLLCCFAEIAKSNRYVRPTIVASGEPLKISEGRHPVIEQISSERFIANDTLLDEGENRTMIITGPNMAGKSTYMRQTALICIMAHLGSFVPAKAAQIPVLDRIFTRVGASDNLISDQSTFMVEMIEVASILRNATKNSFLILDEVGRGTSTYDGLSIAWAVIEDITNRIGAKTMFATHYHELTELENKLQGVKNYKIAVKEINGGVVFLRKIMRGGANRSFGIEVASLAGVPATVTDRAKEILKLVENGGVPKPAEEVVEEQPTEVEKILSEVDLNNLSPMQAFLLVGDLVEKVKKWER